MTTDDFKFRLDASRDRDRHQVPPVFAARTHGQLGTCLARARQTARTALDNLTRVRHLRRPLPKAVGKPAKSVSAPCALQGRQDNRTAATA